MEASYLSLISQPNMIKQKHLSYIQMGQCNPIWVILNRTPTNSNPLTHSHSFLTHSHSFLVHSHSHSTMRSSVLLTLSPLMTMCSLSHLFSDHIQILSSYSPTHHPPFQPIFSNCALRVRALRTFILCAFEF